MVRGETLKNALWFLLSVYFFLLSINLLSSGLKLLGKEAVKGLITTTADPLAGLFIGILATTLIQSSSATTCIVVSIVAVNPSFFPHAIPIVMGANIGTTVTNTLVSFGHVVRRKEFRRAIGGATVHDFFNFMAVVILLPLELVFHPLQHSASFLAEAFEGAGGLEFVSPIKLIVGPARDWLVSSASLLGEWTGVGVVLLAVIVLVLALRTIVWTMRRLALGAEENVVSKYLFGSALLSFFLGVVLTAIIQSSSVTTSLAVPFVGAGLLSLEQVLPYTIGANIGTTVTTLMAALAGATLPGLKIAFVHLMFNVFATCIIYPVKFIPIRLATGLGDLAYRKRRYAIAWVVIVFYTIPVLYLLLTGVWGG